MGTGIFSRSDRNPILSPSDLPVPAGAVLNPGAVEHDGQVVLLLRVEDRAGFSDIHVARSANGVDGWRVEGEPILRHGREGLRYEKWGCEDARVTRLDEDGQWYITYTAYSPWGAAVALARSDDLVAAERVGLIFSPNNKDAVLLSRKYDGRYVVLHRPDAGGIEHIWSATSPDLIHWGHPHCVLPEALGPAWDAVKVGAGPPPLPTDAGWLLIYHGVKAYGGRYVYRAGAALLDDDEPYKVAARSPTWLFQAEAPYELSGLSPNVVFPTGLLRRGEELWMYYGAADTCVGLAVAPLKAVLAALEATPPRPE